MLSTEAKIEGLLFATSEPLSYKAVAGLLKISEDEVRSAVVDLKNRLADHGIVLVEREDMITLGTHAELGPLLESIRKEELEKELSKATLETLSVILYKNGATRSEIDYIRGVNSSFILRNLSIRGLIERTVHPTDSRKILYKPTIEAQNYMGITNLADMPGYTEYHTLLEQSLSDMTSGSEAKEE